ncbi:protein FAM234A [Cyprinodon tularosa]|uniref:protein FAM234A n=1 Tax=Cyprinodon tularosa TaxID=77115 RepID=UPI0018E27122|nr:protein FAM234A [Cyprinodon tularosa]
METTDQITEGSPLKSTEEEAGTITAPSEAELKKKSCKEVLGFSKMTHCRTGVFFLSLFLCLTVVFAFSFIIPCPERPQYNISWSRNFSEAATYDFLAIDNANSDKVMDVLFVLKSAEISPNKTCVDSGLPSPCLFMVALDGTKGQTLWEKPLNAGFHWAQCGLQTQTWHCLLSHSDTLTAIDKNTGNVIWQQLQPTGLLSSLPVLSVPDLDGDDVSDVVLVASDDTQTQLILLSGKTGAQIGSTVIIDSFAANDHLLHQIKDGSYYVLLQNASGLYALALWRIAAKANVEPEPSLKKSTVFEKNASATTSLVPISQSKGGRLLRFKDSDVSSDLVVSSDSEVTVFDGSSLEERWKFSTTSTIGKPSFGHFNTDNVLDLVIEDDVGNSTKRITILDGRTGGLLWDIHSLASANSPQPDAVHATNSFSLFMFWGLVASESNSSEPLGRDRCSYMLYPLHPNYLLECTNITDHIVTFKATLMERGRHAAYFLLMGPEKEGTQGTVVLFKQKLKEDVHSCRVLRTKPSGEPHSDDDIKEVFNRLRFSSDW